MLNRDDSCLSFLLICKCYGKQYAVETTDYSVLDETITKAMIVKMQGIKYVSKNICLCILKLKIIHSGFL